MLSKTNRNGAIRTLAASTELAGDHFKDKNLLAFDVMRAHAQRKGRIMIQGVTFENCQIDGPAILLPINGCDFDDCNFQAPDGDMKTLILRPASPDKIVGVIGLIDCKFKAVDFFGVGFTGNPEFLDSLLSVETRTGDLA